MNTQQAKQLVSDLIKTATEHVKNGEPEMAMVAFDEWAIEYPVAAQSINRDAFELAVMNG